MPRERSCAMTTSQRLRNFARIASLLALARRRDLCAWTMAFRAGATFNALQELNAAGEISGAQYRILDAWIFWGNEQQKARLRKAKAPGRNWWRAKNAKDEKPASSPAAKKTAGSKLHRDQRRGTFRKSRPFKKGPQLLSARSVAAAVARVRPRKKQA
jgi:hypothetical protein